MQMTRESNSLTSEFPKSRLHHRVENVDTQVITRLSAGRRESGSQGPWLGEAAPQPEGNSVCAQQAPARLGFPGALPQHRVVWMWFGAFPGAFGLGRALTDFLVKSLGFSFFFYFFFLF